MVEITMDSRKILLLLNLLARETSENKEELSSLFKRALDADDNICQLKDILDNTCFFKKDQNYSYGEGKAVVEKLYHNPIEAVDLFPSVIRATENIKRDIEYSHNLLASPYPFAERISAVPLCEIQAYRTAYKNIANVSTYLSVLYAGLPSVSSLSWNDDCDFYEMLNAVNAKFLPGLQKLSIPSSWMIKKKRMRGKALFGGDCLFIEYCNKSEFELQCKNLNTEPIGTHAYLNVDAYESDENDVPFCWGTGNILSVSPLKGTFYLHNDVVTKLRSPSKEEIFHKMPTPYECINILADNKMFCISPGELLRAMNRWYVGHEIEKRVRMRQCLFCGNSVNGSRLVCPNHFTSQF
jgi:hypothetical protein